MKSVGSCRCCHPSLGDASALPRALQGLGVPVAVKLKVSLGLREGRGLGLTDYCSAWLFTSCSRSAADKSGLAMSTAAHSTRSEQSRTRSGRVTASHSDLEGEAEAASIEREKISQPPRRCSFEPARPTIACLSRMICKAGKRASRNIVSTAPSARCEVAAHSSWRPDGSVPSTRRGRHQADHGTSPAGAAAHGREHDRSGLERRAQAHRRPQPTLKLAISQAETATTNNSMRLSSPFIQRRRVLRWRQQPTSNKGQRR